MRKKTYKTIKQAAEALLMQVSYVDVYGRKVGLTYKAILKRLHLNFPKSNTSLRSLQIIAYALNGSDKPMPVRRRSPRILAQDYARTLLLAKDKDGMGLSLAKISRKTFGKFPEYEFLSKEQLSGLARYLSKRFTLPPRPSHDK